MTKVGAVLVVGGGIGGMQAALDLAESDFKVYLVERGPSIGGVMAQLDKTFPTNDCAMCTMAPRLVEVARHPNIELLTQSEIEGVSGEAGRFEVAIRRRTRYVDEQKCTGCGTCAEHCPVLTRDEFNCGLSARPAVFLNFPQAIPRIYSIDRSLCLGCGLCKNLCGPGAIDYRLEDQVRTIEVGAIVAAPGSDPFDPKLNGDYGYGRSSNVVTSVDFERILSASGPYRGAILRPSDGTVPKRIAFIHCVGSRDHERDYCSAVCCMYTAKQAIIAKEHVGEHLQCDVFFMDLRSYGKGFEQYYNRAQQLGVRYIRCRPTSVEEVPATGNMLIQYLAEDDAKRSAEYDLVVLAVGLSPSKSTPDLARKLGLSLNKFGFCDTQPFTPVQSPREGVFVAGTFTSPKDIPESVVQSCAAASKAMTLLAEARGTLTHRKESPPERDVVGAEPRVGVFVCHCGTNIGGVVNVPAVVEYAKTLANVVHVEENLYTCAADSTEKIGQRIAEHNLNRVVVASCTPRTHEGLFRGVCRDAGLNEYLFEMANIRDQNSWVHMKEPAKATKKAKDLVRIAVAKARLLQPLTKGSIRVRKAALVIGGGISGMTAALDLADQGFPVCLIEKDKELGGHLRRVHTMLGGEDPQKRLAEIVEKVLHHPKISVNTETRLVSLEGSQGNFRSKISSNGLEAEIEHGAVIVAIGALEYKPTEYMYGRDPRIITQSELEERIAGNGNRRLDPPPRTVVMIQCVGSRDDERPYCSRVCCSQATKNALTLKDLYPETETFILYRDVRTYGLMEEYYTKARERGVRYILFDETKKPGVTVENGRLQVLVDDATLQLTLGIEPDLLVLSNGVIPAEDTAGLAQILKVPLSQEKFLLEAHMKLRPVDFATDGIFLCGSAHFPKHVEECIAQASATASRAATILAKDFIELDAAISEVNDANCDGCGYCVDPCPYHAITLIEFMTSGGIKKTVERDEGKCKGCGVCQATCPKMGIFVRGFTPGQLSAMVNATLEGRT